MEIRFPTINQKNPNAPSMAESINLHKKAGTLAQTVTFYEPKMATTAPQKKVAEPSERGFFERTADNFRALKDNEISFKDVLREIPKNSIKVPVKIAETVAPGITKFFKTTGSIFGEGMAYALDKNVREQYRGGQVDKGEEQLLAMLRDKRSKGEDTTQLIASLKKLQVNKPIPGDNLSILPTITETTIPKLAKYTFAAGLETAIFRSLPNVAKMKMAQIGGVGAIEGIGFAISEGLARDESAEEIIKKFPLYGISGGALAILTPYLLPLMKTEMKYLPGQIRGMFKGVEKEIADEATRKLSVNVATPDFTAVPISTPNKRYQAYLRSQGYEPYIPNEKLPVIEGGPKVVNRDLPQVPEGRVTPVIDVKDLEPPKVGSERVPATTKTKTEIEEDYLISQGYERYVPESELPVISGGPSVTKARTQVPDGRVEPSIDVKDLQPPKVNSPKTKTQIEEDYLRSQGYEPYTPDADLPVIQTQSKSPKGQTSKVPATAKASGPDIEYIYDVNMPQVAQKAIATAKPKTISVKAENGTTKTYIKTSSPKVKEPDFEYVYNVNSPSKSQAEVASSRPQRVSVKAEDGTTRTYVKSGNPTKAKATETTLTKTDSTPNVSKKETVSVPARQLPVGDGPQATSRLEQRMRQSLDDAPNLTGEKAATYQQMNKQDQIRKAAKFVTENEEEAMAVLRGEREAPEGILDNAIALALAKQAEDAGDAALAVRLASLRSTRAGQEISFLTEVDPDSVVSALETIIKARTGRATRTSGGTTIKASLAKTKAEGQAIVTKAQLKFDEVEKLLNDILC